MISGGAGSGVTGAGVGKTSGPGIGIVSGGGWGTVPGTGCGTWNCCMTAEESQGAYQDPASDAPGLTR
jgi:hypothetical protein